MKDISGCILKAGDLVLYAVGKMSYKYGLVIEEGRVWSEDGKVLVKDNCYLARGTEGEDVIRQNLYNSYTMAMSDIKYKKDEAKKIKTIGTVFNINSIIYIYLGRCNCDVTTETILQSNENILQAGYLYLTIPYAKLSEYKDLERFVVTGETMGVNVDMNELASTASVYYTSYTGKLGVLHSCVGLYAQKAKISSVDKLYGVVPLQNLMDSYEVVTGTRFVYTIIFHRKI